MRTEDDTDRGRNEVQQSYYDHLGFVNAELLETLSRVTAIQDAANIDKVVKVAANIARKLSVQRCRMEFFAFAPRKPIVGAPSGAVKDRNGKNDGDNAKGIVLLSISPGLCRIGDERGGSLDRDATTIYPAGVFLDATS